MELAIFEHYGLASRLSVLDGKDLLLKQLDILRREKEDALVKVQYLGIITSTNSLHLLAPRLILSFQNRRLEELEQL